MSGHIFYLQSYIHFHSEGGNGACVQKKIHRHSVKDSFVKFVGMGGGYGSQNQVYFLRDGDSTNMVKFQNSEDFDTRLDQCDTPHNATETAQE